MAGLTRHAVAGSPPSAWTDEDKRRFEVTMRDLGASFRRIEALHADVRANGGSFEAMRVAVDFTGGGEVTRLLTIDPARREACRRRAGRSSCTP